MKSINVIDLMKYDFIGNYRLLKHIKKSFNLQYECAEIHKSDF